MIRRILLSITVAISGCLCLVESSATAALNQQASLVVISWQIHLDDATNFDFTRLSVSIQRRPGKYHAWSSVGSFVPNKEGRFVTTVPAGSYLSVDVVTSDPTVQRSTRTADDVEFYRLEKDKNETVMLEEFYVPGDSPERIERRLELQRGSAFSVCVPNGLKSGSIQLHRQSKPPKEGINVWSFSDSATIQDSVVAGLEPGPWRVLYVGDNDVIFRSEEFDLRRGEVLRPQCVK